MVERMERIQHKNDGYYRRNLWIDEEAKMKLIKGRKVYANLRDMFDAIRGEDGILRPSLYDWRELSDEEIKNLIPYFPKESRKKSPTWS